MYVTYVFRVKLYSNDPPDEGSGLLDTYIRGQEKLILLSDVVYGVHYPPACAPALPPSRTPVYTLAVPLIPLTWIYTLTS